MGILRNVTGAAVAVFFILLIALTLVFLVLNFRSQRRRFRMSHRLPPSRRRNRP